MSTWLEPLISNAIAATLLAMIVGVVALFRPRPAVMHALWLIVLLKLVTPPLIRIELPTRGERDGLKDRENQNVGWVESSRPTADDVPEVGGARRLDPPYGYGIPTGWAAMRGLDEPVDERLTGGPWDGTGFDPNEEGDVESGIASNVRPYRDELRPSVPHRPTDIERSPRVRLSAVTRQANLVLSRASHWLPVSLVWVWPAGSAAWFLLAVVRLVRFRRQLARTRPASEDVQAIAREIAVRLGLRSTPIVRVTDASLPPLLTTLGRRGVVLLPSELLRDLSPAQQAAIIGHELAHFHRRDHWVRWVEFVAVGLYWWHPVAWLARRQLQQAEELCCDAWVYRVFPDQARGYAQALMATVDFLSVVRTPAPAGACGFGHVHSLKRRLDMILKRTWRPDVSSAARLSLIAVAIGVLPWTPSLFSQDAPTKAPTLVRADVVETASPVEARSVDTPTPDDPPVRNIPAQNAAVTDSQPAIALPSQDTAPAVQGAGLGSVSADGRTGTSNQARSRRPSTEERLDRLEKMLAQLVDAMKQPNTTAAPDVARTFYRGTAGTEGEHVYTPHTAKASPVPPNADTGGYGPVATQPRATTGKGWSAERSKADLVDLEYEIKTLELQLQRAKAQYEILQKQLKDELDAGSNSLDSHRRTRVAPAESTPQTTGTAR